MTRTLFYSLGFALALALCSAPLPDAYAGQTVTIDSNVNDNVLGNSPKSDHTWTPGVDDFADLLDSNGNKVTVNSDVTGSVYGGYAESDSGSATVTGNSVTINGGTVGDGSSNVFGGYAASDSGSATATATGNRVTINGGTVTGTVYGGIAYSDSGSATATHNTVTISGNTKFDGSNSHLNGGYAVSLGGGTTDLFTGNTLNVWNYTGTPVTSVQFFQNYNFVFPVTQSGAVLTATSTVTLGNNTLNKASTITASTIGGSNPLQPGATVTLIDGTITNNGFNTQATGKHGATLLYDWTLATSGAALTATLDSVQLNPQAKALSEGWLGGLALTTQGADLVAGQGMGNAVGAAQGADGNGFGAFAALSGGSMRYNTGSHVDMNSVSLMTGLAWGVDTTPGHLTLGAFFEYGTGSYDTHNSFSNAASVDGDGDTYYLGGGILGRMDFQNTGPGRFYTEASARMGKVHNEYENSDLRDPLDRNADYDSSSLYYGLHLGTGYVWNITEKASLDLYGKYFWTRQEGDSVTLSTDDPVRFKDADSHRLRGGARFAYAVNEYVSPYLGAAYEHEFDGKARASTYGYGIDAPELTGDTGIGEIGLTLKPSATLPLSFDLGVQGYTGQREGVTGSLQAKFEF